MTGDELRLWIPGRPVPYDRARSATSRRTGRPIRVHSPRYRDWRRLAATVTWAELRRSGTDGFDGPVTVRVRVEADGVAVRVAPTGRLRPVGVRGDLDNYVKAVLDGLQTGGAVTDDRLVESITAAFGGREEKR